MNLKEDMYYASMLLNFALFFLLSLMLLFFSDNLLDKYVVKPVKIDGYSMYPTLDDGEIYYLDLLTPPERFDIVVFSHDKNTSYIKRLIGMPGDTVAVRDSKLYINEKQQSEPYLEDNLFSSYIENYHEIPYTTDFTLEELTNGKYKKVPENYYLVLGDNRPISSDSREFGLVEKDKLRGHLLGFTPDKTYKIERKQKELQRIALQEIN